MNILFRADGSSEKGMGHMVRSMALADEFKDRNHTVYFMVKEDEFAKEFVDKRGLKRLDYIDKNDLDLFAYITDKHAIDLMISDVDEYDNKFFSFLREKEIYSVQLDIHRKMTLGVDLLINGGIYAKELEDEALLEGQNVLLGPEYNLLRKEFSRANKKDHSEDIKNILITMGATDVHNLTEVVTRTCLEVYSNAIIHVVVGSNKQPFDNKDFYKHSSLNLYYKIPYMYELMEMADIAICSGGVTIYELVATATPSIIITQAKNQIRQSLEFSAREAAIYYGTAEDFDSNEFRKILFKINDPILRHKLSSSSRKLIDGKGVERVVNYLLTQLD